MGGIVEQKKRSMTLYMTFFYTVDGVVVFYCGAYDKLLEKQHVCDQKYKNVVYCGT